MSTGQECHTCPTGGIPNVLGLWGFGSPTTTLFASTKPVVPAYWTSSSNAWTPLNNVPSFMGGTGNSCVGIWGSSPTDMWFGCTHGAFHYVGSDTWDATSELDVTSIFSIWGSSPYDVYAVGADANGAGLVYHYY